MKIQIDEVEILEISEAELKCLNNYLLDVGEWIKGVVLGKINNCKKRMIRDWQPKLFNDPNVENIPATEEGMINAIIERDDYEDRATRIKDV